MRTRDREPSRPDSRRPWSIRRKIIAVLLVPLVTLVGMWALATWVTLGPGLDLLDAQNNLDNVGIPSQALIAELQTERKLSFGYVATGRGDARTLLAQRGQTDAAIADFRRQAGSEDARDAATEETGARLDELLLYLDSLPSLRKDVDDGTLDRSATLRRFNQIIESSFSVYSTLIRVSNEDLAREARALMAMGRAREVLAQEDAVITGALSAGVFPAVDLGQAVLLIGAQRYQFEVAAPDLDLTDRVEYEALTAGGAHGSLTALENRVLADARAGAPPPIGASDWRAAYDRVSGDLQRLELAAADRLVERGRPEARFIFARILVAGLLGLIAVVVTSIASLQVGRSLIRRLAGLRQAAQELAIDRLPRVVSQLRQGEHVDVAAQAPPLPYGEDEIGQVGHAFNALQRTAVESAVAEANVRRGVNEVFLNIARRSQTLLHRQLSILDRMERRTEDATELEDLFRIDHLATRMRRHAEDLVILAGAAPGRGWRNPVPLVDVLRGAVSEVEDYARVSIRPVPEVAVAGRAVADVIHLLAELIENATSFSPPHTRVNIGAEPVTHGLAIEIEDRGLGMAPTALAAFNVRLADPPDFDPGTSAQLGLFVVARLAARHGVQVQLRSSPYGGITAVALLPDPLLAVPGEQPALPPGTSATIPDQSTGGAFVELSEASPTAPRSPGAIYTPVTGEGDPLPSRRPTPAQAQAMDHASGVIIATPGKPIPRHARQEVIDATNEGDDGLPRRVRQTNLAPQLYDSSAEVDNATQGPGSRSPEELRAMMSSFQAGMARGRRDADDDQVATDDVDRDPTVDRDTTLEAT
jgi:signal transduction histidine kinase